MFLQNHINADSLKIVQDSIKTAVRENDVISKLGFNISNVGSDEIVLTVLGYGIVFLALLTLYLFFANLTRLIVTIRRNKLKLSGKQTTDKNDTTISGEVAAAISTAISLHFQEAHDIENTIITIKKVQSAYSPWNSKLHGLRQNPKY
jgi:glutaconyl-CoA/methylmalonyl-CoA decarboxylase subunit delta